MLLSDVRVGQVVRCHGALENLDAPDGVGRVVEFPMPNLPPTAVLVELTEIDGLDERPPLDDGGRCMCFAYGNSYLELLENAPVATSNLRISHIARNQEVTANHAPDSLDRATNEITEIVDELGNVTREINGEPEAELLARLGSDEETLNAVEAAHERIRERLSISVIDPEEFKARYGIRKLNKGPAIGRGKRRLGI